MKTVNSKVDFRQIVVKTTKLRTRIEPFDIDLGEHYADSRIINFGVERLPDMPSKLMLSFGEAILALEMFPSYTIKYVNPNVIGKEMYIQYDTNDILVSVDKHGKVLSPFPFENFVIGRGKSFMLIKL